MMISWLEASRSTMSSTSDESQLVKRVAQSMGASLSAPHSSAIATDFRAIISNRSSQHQKTLPLSCCRMAGRKRRRRVVT